MRIVYFVIGIVLAIVVARCAGGLGLLTIEADAPCYEDDFDRCRNAAYELQNVSNDSCDGAGRRVCLVPLGLVSPDLMQHLATHYQAQYGLDIGILRPIGIPEYLVERDRPQPSSLPAQLPDLLEEAVRRLPFVPTRAFGEPDHDQIGGVVLREFMKVMFEEESADPDVVLIGITPLDLYFEEEDWRFAFGVRGFFDDPSAVISTFRMDPQTFGEDPDADRLHTRARKMTTKYIGLLLFGLPESSDPSSPVYNRIFSLGALDRIDEPQSLP